MLVTQEKPLLKKLKPNEVHVGISGGAGVFATEQSGRKEKDSSPRTMLWILFSVVACADYNV